MGGVSSSAAQPFSIVEPRTFVFATRESGYRDLSVALAELIDNSLQAGAAHVDMFIRPVDSIGAPSVVVAVLDDGEGMPPASLRRAIQFGGTDRFDDRAGFGRFGMGLPNSSVSQTRRLEVYSWRRPGRVWYSYLDIDEVSAGRMQCIPPPVLRTLPDWISYGKAKSGTLVVWARCDRLEGLRHETLIGRVSLKIGRLFRYEIWKGVRIRLNGSAVSAVDPLLVDKRTACHGAKLYGSPLRYQVKTAKGMSRIDVRFSQLPVQRWRKWSSDMKRRRGVLGAAGVSVVRGSREIDYGWHLFGGKRRENYDDWWRCEIRFHPSADELFGVTHSKQGVNPTSALKALLESDLESIARSLNRSVRNAFNRAGGGDRSGATTSASRRDVLLPRPQGIKQMSRCDGDLSYVLRTDPLPGPEFYTLRMSRGILTLTLNTNHPFFTSVYGARTARSQDLRGVIESLVLAAARADLEASNSREQHYVCRSRRAWSDALAAFLRS